MSLIAFLFVSRDRKLLSRFTPTVFSERFSRISGNAVQPPFAPLLPPFAPLLPRTRSGLYNFAQYDASYVRSDSRSTTDNRVPNFFRGIENAKLMRTPEGRKGKSRPFKRLFTLAIQKELSS